MKEPKNTNTPNTNTTSKNTTARGEAVKSAAKQAAALAREAQRKRIEKESNDRIKNDPMLLRLLPGGGRAGRAGTGGAGGGNNAGGGNTGTNTGKNLGDDPQQTDQEKSKSKVTYAFNQAKFREAVPFYLQGYVNFQDKTARLFTDRDGSQFIFFKVLTPRAEMEGDAILLAGVLEQWIPPIIERWGFLIVFGMFVKYTLANWGMKKRETPTIKPAMVPQKEGKNGS